jgi:hypothetical protein
MAQTNLRQHFLKLLGLTRPLPLGIGKHPLERRGRQLGTLREKQGGRACRQRDRPLPERPQSGQSSQQGAFPNP